MSEGADQEDKTEEPSQRRIDQAIEKGNVANSVEINTFFMLGAFTLALMLAAGPVATKLMTDIRGFLAHAHAIPSDPQAYAGLAGRVLIIFLQAIAIPAAMVATAALAAGMIQHPPVFTAQSLAPKFERISPMAGMKRLLGIEAFVQFGKGLAKLGVVGVVGGTILWGQHDRLEAFAQLDPAAGLRAVLALALKMMGGVLAAYVAIALGDALYQRHRWRSRLRMTKEELKQEHKESEGSPEVKGRRKQLMHQRVKKRMMAAVPTATVIITNPTHYAVALRYEPGMGAPICVAKGVDSLAFRIRAVATEAGVPVLENPPLARALHATVEIDDEIPAEHYRAVAEVIGFVLRLRKRAA
ncbi:flagellar biosynthesis protein FlhB [Methylobacterium thuringiense]|uniref:Flagellar biosynthetic protein FlhB n=1 Tax=Methylobacterium thuringiense TaxID=1003091 RepID=A0ABQ4TLA7_9HYPH|nr:flagellar biosynthesis protein FlhB [Methylobacterium thuringiense]GJE56129.1 Flagellar biosynthetic protein FlhB [Methylobacterium thuringiense]